MIGIEQIIYVYLLVSDLSGYMVTTVTVTVAVVFSCTSLVHADK